jgi:hypothetical protein
MQNPAVSSLPRQITFLIPNLHFPSPQTRLNFVSILAHTVTVRYDASVVMAALAKVLGEVVYDIPDSAEGRCIDAN